MTFKVYMHHELVDFLDDCFSPGDGIQAIQDVFMGLPDVHHAPIRKSSSHPLPKRLKVYHARLAWYPLGFSYVQIDSELHVVNLWPYEPDSHHPEIPVVVSPSVWDGKALEISDPAEDADSLRLNLDTTGWKELDLTKV